MDGIYFVPTEWRRNLGPSSSAHAPRTEHRLMGRVLVEVHKHPLAAVLLPPLCRKDVRATPLKLSCNRHCCGSHLIRVPAGLEPDVYVQPLIARRLGIADDSQLIEKTSQLARRLADVS